MDLEGSGRGPVVLSSLKFLGCIEEYLKIRQYSRYLYCNSQHTSPWTILLVRCHDTRLLGENLLDSMY
jgi:hypothetical protein